jgi:hypothetical protein
LKPPSDFLKYHAILLEEYYTAWIVHQLADGNDPASLSGVIPGNPEG